MSNKFLKFFQEDEVGTVKSPRYHLPDPDFTYGQYLPRDKEGAGEGFS